MKHNMTRALLIVVLLGTLSMLFKTETASASGTIYIRENGDVDPPTAPINRAGDIYTLTSNIYETIAVQRDNIIVNGNGYILQGSGSSAGFDLTNRHNVTLNNTRITQFNYGVYLYESNNNTISYNNLTNNAQHGIFVSNSSSNIISRNEVVSNGDAGIFLWLTNNTQVNGNNVTENGGDGISIGYKSLHNTITYNTVRSNSDAGISLGWEFSTHNQIVGNNITQNGWTGIYLVWSTVSENEFYHNNLGNAMQVYSVNALNIWNSSYPSGGNHWSDYAGLDLCWGPYQNRIGSDGIGDTPYIIDANNADYYPLMSPYEYWINPIVGDINKDTKVDNNDLSQLAIAFGSTPERPNWNPNSDINSNNMVNVLDVFRLGKNFGKTSNADDI